MLARFVTWQSMRAIAPSSVDDIPQLQSETYKALPLTKSGPALNETLVVSQKMVAYIASFLGTSCFVRSLDPRIEGRPRAGQILLQCNQDIVGS